MLSRTLFTRMGLDRHAAGWRFVLGEIAITTVGILIAVAVNAWWENRQDRRTELEALREMRAGLTIDLHDLREDLSRYRRVDRSTRLLLDRLHRGLPFEPGLDTSSAPSSSTGSTSATPPPTSRSSCAASGSSPTTRSGSP